jgi:hypothetical protein
MTVYRLGYNPTDPWGWSFKGQLKEAREALNAFAKGRPHRTRWSCGANVAIGDELFLIRLGDSQPRGLVGHGRFTSTSERTGVRRFGADVEFDALVLFGPPIIPMADLEDIPHRQDLEQPVHVHDHQGEGDRAPAQALDQGDHRPRAAEGRLKAPLRHPERTEP